MFSIKFSNNYYYKTNYEWFKEFTSNKKNKYILKSYIKYKNILIQDALKSCYNKL